MWLARATIISVTSHRIVVLALALAACGDNHATTPDAAVDAASPDATTLVDFVGSWMDTWRNDHVAELAQAHDLSHTTIAAVCGDVMIAGAGLADGTFTIRGLPPGVCDVQVGAEVFVTAARTLELGADYDGRPPPLAMATHSTPLELIVSNMQAFDAANDGIQVTLPDLPFNLYDSAFEDATLTTQQPVPQSATGFTAYLEVLGSALIKSSLGDRLDVYHLRSATVGSVGLDYIVDALELSVEETDGQLAVASGAFIPVPTVTTTYNWSGSTFALYSPAGATLVDAPSTDLEVTSPAGVQHELAFWADPADTQTLMLPLGNPAPTTWPLSQSSVYPWIRHYATAGHTGDIEIWNITFAPLTAGPIEPVTSPVQNPTIQGGDLATDKTGVTTSPTIAWTAPIVGTVTEYQIEIDAWQGDQPTSTVTFYTTDTQLQIPPGFLDAATTYSFVVTALVGTDPAHPHRNVSPTTTFGSAAFASGQMHS